MANVTDEISKLKEITDKLEQGIAELFESEKYMEYLRTMSRFYNYSFNNTLLIAMQKPDATLIAGYKSWQNNFERHVLKGEKGISIIAPAPYRKKEAMEKIDPDTQMPVLDLVGKPVVEEVEITIPAFRVVPVFDVSQTEGKEISDIEVNELMGTVENYTIFMQALSEVSPAPIEYETIDGGAKGYYSPADRRIAIQKDMSEIQTMKTAIHEIAHAKLHDVERNKELGIETLPKDHRTKEVEAESVAYTVCQHYGIETSDYSFGYVAGWSSGKELSELKSSLELIRKTASELINSIDDQVQQFLMKELEVEQIKNHVEAEDPNYSISFYAAECMEFTNYREYHEHLSLDEAVKIYEAIPSKRLNAGKGIGFIQHNANETRPGFEESSFDLYSSGKVDEDIINLIPEFKNNPLVQQAIQDIKKCFPSVIPQKKTIENISEKVEEDMPEKTIEPTVTIIRSESPFLKEGTIYPISEVSKLFGDLDSQQQDDREKPDYDGISYHKTRFQIEYIAKGKLHKYGGRQDLGDGDGNLIDHIRGNADYYLKNKEYQKYLKGSNQGEYEQAIKHYEYVIDVFVPYLRMHCNLSEIEQNIKDAMGLIDGHSEMTKSHDGRMDYYKAMLDYVADSRENLNSNKGELKPMEPPKMDDYLRKNLLEKVEELMEGNNNLIDGVVNNEKPIKADELDHKKISIRDRLAVNRDRIEKKHDAPKQLKDTEKTKKMRIE